jgi:tRNA pseudouridine55 synthase
LTETNKDERQPAAVLPGGGFLNLYKPAGMTSFAAVKQIKKRLPKVKIGHLGTLDPMVAGVLPIALGSGARLIEYIEDHTKTYLATMTLGGVSDTQDAWGTITPTACRDCRREELEQVLAGFRGDIRQIPPMYSAVHHQGKRLYELARQGLEVEREARPARIHRLEIKDFAYDEAGNRVITLEIDCSSGTYIRTLCHDIGAGLATGAYMSSLERLRWGTFYKENSLPLENLVRWPDYWLPAGQVLRLPEMYLTAEQAEEILHGRALGLTVPAAGPLLLYDHCRRLIAVAHIDGQGRIQPRKVFPV